MYNQQLLTQITTQARRQIIINSFSQPHLTTVDFFEMLNLLGDKLTKAEAKLAMKCYAEAKRDLIEE